MKTRGTACTPAPRKAGRRKGQRAWRVFLLLALSGGSLVPRTALGDDSGLRTMLAGDLVGRFDLGGSEALDELSIRSVELGFYGPVDHTFDASLFFAAHPAKEGLGVEIHEATMTAARWPLPVQVKVGQFFLVVGRLNPVHQHDRPFVSTPGIHELVFDDEEGAMDTGAEFKILASWEPATELTLGVTNGFTFGHSHTKGQKPKEPLLYARLSVFGDARLLGLQNASSGALLGASYLRRRPDLDAGPSFDLVGLDFTLKVRDGATLIWHWLSEAWYRELSREDSKPESHLGAYSFLERQLWDRLFLGLRLEGLGRLNQKDLLGRREKNHTLAGAPVLTWRHSEFQLLRLEYLMSRETLRDRVQDAHSLALQTSFILGAHPAHDF